MSSSGAGSKRGREREQEAKNNQELALNLKSPSFSVIKKEMCLYCLHVLYHYLCNKDHHGHKPSLFPNKSYPLFVTWKIANNHTNNGPQLRGCIGTFSPTMLHDGLKDYAIKSAIEDERFPPIRSPEFPYLQCSVSILLDFTPGQNYKDWIIGVHGIRISYKSGNKTFSATYLPQVAKEQGWNHETTIDSLLRKAGYLQPINDEVRENVRLTKYLSEHMTVPASEYLNAVNSQSLRL